MSREEIKVVYGDTKETVLYYMEIYLRACLLTEIEDDIKRAELGFQHNRNPPLTSVELQEIKDSHDTEWLLKQLNDKYWDDWCDLHVISHPFHSRMSMDESLDQRIHS